MSIGLNEEQCMQDQNIPLEKHLGVESREEEEHHETEEGGYKGSPQRQHNGVYLTVPDFYMG